jgi:hypothetical protein
VHVQIERTAPEATALEPYVERRLLEVAVGSVAVEERVPLQGNATPEPGDIRARRSLHGAPFDPLGRSATRWGGIDGGLDGAVAHFVSRNELDVQRAHAARSRVIREIGHIELGNLPSVSMDGERGLLGQAVGSTLVDVHGALGEIDDPGDNEVAGLVRSGDLDHRRTGSNGSRDTGQERQYESKGRESRPGPASHRNGLVAGSVITWHALQSGSIPIQPRPAWQSVQVRSR